MNNYNTILSHKLKPIQSCPAGLISFRGKLCTRITVDLFKTSSKRLGTLNFVSRQAGPSGTSAAASSRNFEVRADLIFPIPLHPKRDSNRITNSQYHPVTSRSPIVAICSKRPAVFTQRLQRLATPAALPVPTPPKLPLSKEAAASAGSSVHRKNSMQSLSRHTATPYISSASPLRLLPASVEGRTDRRRRPAQT